MTGKARKVVRVTKFLLAGVIIFCMSWIVSVNEWHAGVHWNGSQIVDKELSTMRTIVAYSEGKQAEMDRPSPVTCGHLPAFPKVSYINHTWSGGPIQESTWQNVPGTQVSLYGAYYDERTSQRYIRILAMFHGRNISTDDTLYCQTRSMNSYENTVEVVAAKPLEIWWKDWDVTSTEVITPLLLSCPLTESLKNPSIVSVVIEPCDDPKNAFTLKSTSGKIKQKRNFTICVKDMSFDNDISQSLIEWIEINKILGVDIIDMYIDKISKEIENVLQYYRDEGYIRLYNVPINNNPTRSLWQRRRDHIITYNDCLYRNIDETEFIIPLDIDEIVLPKTTSTWPELIHSLKKLGWNPKEYSAIMIQNVFFFDVLQRIGASKNLNDNSNESYVKQDDVRIAEDGNVDLRKVVLVDDVNNLNHEYNDIKYEEDVYYAKYKSRCGHDLAVPKVIKHIISSAVVSPVGFYTKSFMRAKKVLTAFNHYPLASLGSSGFNGWSAPFNEVQLNHYKESCNMTIVVECEQYLRQAHYDRVGWRFRRKLISALGDAVCRKTNYI